MNAPTRPFLVIGAQKAGTTSLYNYLAAHPDIYGSPVKEPKYFLNERPTPDERRRYHELFEGRTSQRRTFEATPHYTQYPGYVGVPRRIAAELPDAQLIYIIRHPIERTYSHYMFRLTSAEAREFRGFEEALDLHPFYTYISRYHSQLEQYLEVFPRERIHVVLFEDLKTRPAETLRGMFEFLDVDPDVEPPNIRTVYKETAQRTFPSPMLRWTKRTGLYDRVHWRLRDWLRSSGRSAPPAKAEILTPGIYNRLHALLRDDVERLRDFLRRDLPWDFPHSKFR